MTRLTTIGLALVICAAVGAAADIFKSPKTAYTRALFAAAFNLETSPEVAVAE